MRTNIIKLPSGSKVNITELVEASPILESQLRWLIKTPNYNGSNSTSLQSVSSRFSVVVFALKYVNNKFPDCKLAKDGFNAFINNGYELLKRTINSDLRKEATQELVYALKVYTGHDISRSILWPEAYLILPVGESDVSDLYEFSPILVEDLRNIVASDRYQGHKGHNLKSMNHRLRVIVTACRYVINHIDKADYLKMGLRGFFVYDYLLLKSTYASEIRSELFNELRFALEIFKGESVLRHNYIENLLSFYFKEYDKWRYIDCKELAGTLPNVFAELKNMYRDEISLIEQKNYNMETLHTRFSKTKRLLLNYIYPNFSQDIIKYGIQCLGRNNNKIQKQLFQIIQSQVQEKIISLRTGTGYFEVIRWLMERFGQQATDAYRISMQRYQRHAKRTKLENVYSDEELVELIYYLEAALASATESKAKVALLFAKIQIKTCWNKTPLCNVELTDINEIELPTAKKTMLIMVQKARKNYDIDTYKLDGRTVNSVMIDIRSVKELTEPYRLQMSACSHLLFIYQEFGEIYPISPNNIVSYVNLLLSNQGCRVRYNTQKVRTSGANDIYRQVAKDLRKYKQTMRHSFSTFIQNYQKIVEVDTQLTLSDAIHTMQAYFTGREISPNIIILDNDEPNCQQTPTGLCASVGGDVEAVQYHKEHRLLHNQNGQEGRWCSDYLACIWCKYYRTVADPEHVWQLLSYRDYVLEDMSASISNLEQNERQTEIIQTLRGRVADILEQLKLRNPKAVEHGINLQKKNGLHPFWEFAVTSVSI
ncbi:hypothetical protein FKN08_24375 [Vibrio sp. 1-2 (7-a)]|uniref:hypothetical protein n=1 Tax=Vibrio sp. 1-2 (7-a) TaxID=2591010 RepID=UPI00148272B9|nr:hypothetical protein [Vibrio sp. 1-2 (7-a)]NNN59235.1 hypothetical protein [Vibrio sp. 1-2 (7-a)]